MQTKYLSEEKIIDKVMDLPQFIHYLENTDACEWQINTVRNKDNSKNCVMGHLVNYVYGKNYDGSVSLAWDIFEETWSTTFYIYEVNDGKKPAYQQATAKERIIAYLKDLWLGLKTPTWRAYELYAQGIYDVE